MVEQPSARQVRIKAQACRICHNDSVTREGLLPGIEDPRVPGHEIAGIIDAIGKHVIECNVGRDVASIPD
jgi:D-arabinose 1-dehydrogenase-like Zn-dependent alcohol dehydrogenase